MAKALLVRLKLMLWIKLATFKVLRKWSPLKSLQEVRRLLHTLKATNMTEKEIMFMVQGMLRTLIKDKNYFYQSSVGSSYCHLTDDGRRALIEMLDMVAPKLYEAMHNEDVERSKQLVLKELKGE